jgi:uncharacterized protein YcbX
MIRDLRLSLPNATELQSQVTYGDKSHLVTSTDNSQVLWFMRASLHNLSTMVGEYVYPAKSVHIETYVTSPALTTAFQS